MKKERQIRKSIGRAGQWILAGIYPPKCPFCNRLTGTRMVTGCKLCREKLPFIQGPRCFQCGKPVRSEEMEYCMDCAQKQHFFRQGISLWSYDKTVKQAVYGFKYKNKRIYAGYFAKELVKYWYNQIKIWNADAVIPVPIHKRRYRQRGYNQAELLAKELAKYIEVPVRTDVVYRCKNTKPQKQLNDKERQKNLKNAFKIAGNGVQLKKVIVVDDIYTTGTTVDVLAELLLGAGVLEVYVITLCIGKGY